MFLEYAGYGHLKSDPLPADTGHTRDYYLSKDKILLQ